VAGRRRVPLGFRWAFVWGRWAAKHPRVAIAVYLLELLVAPAVWLVLGLGWIAALVVLGIEGVAFFVVVPLWINKQRRRRGLPTVSPLWRRAFRSDG
jgi:hypothetical protein